MGCSSFLSRLKGQKPKVSENDFQDLLSNQGFSSKSDRKGPKTIAEMRKQELSKDMDPLKLKVWSFDTGYFSLVIRGVNKCVQYCMKQGWVEKIQGVVGVTRIGPPNKNMGHRRINGKCY